MEFGIDGHSDPNRPIDVFVRANEFGNVVVAVTQGYPRVSLFLHPLHFHQLRHALNDFDVTEIVTTVDRRPVEAGGESVEAIG